MDSNSVFYDLYLREHMRAPLREVGATSREVFGAVDKDVMTVQRSLSELGRPIRVQVDSSGIRQAHSDLSALNNKMSMLGQSSAMMFGNLAAQGVRSAAGFVEEQAKSVLSSGMEGSLNKKKFEVMSGKEAGGQLYSDVKGFVRESIFGNELYKDAITMEGFGLAVKDIMPYMKMLGDVSMGDKQHMESLTLAFSQTTAAGKLMGNDLLQYISAGFNPLTVIAEHTHKTIAQLRAEMEKGKISSDMVAQSLRWATDEGGKWHGMLDEIAKSAGGKWQAMLGNIDDAKLQLGTDLLPAVGKVMDEFKLIVDDMPQTLKKIKPELEDTITGFADMVKWTRTHTDELGTMVRTMKVGVEVFAAYKLGAVAMTGANWLWAQSTAALAPETTAVTAALNLETEELLAQTAVVEQNTLAWVALNTEQRAALVSLDALAASSAALPLSTAGYAAQMGAGNAALAGGFAGAVSSAVIPVAIAYFTGSALAQWMDAGKRGSFYQNTLGYDDHGNMNEFYDVFGKNEEKKRRAALDRAGYSASEIDAYRSTGENPTASAAGVNMDFLAGMGIVADKVGSKVADKYQPKKSPLVQAGEEAFESVTGGGKKTVNITFKNFVENLNNYQTNSRDGGLAFTEDNLKIMLNELLESIN